nr:immunoglobulin heavy chain junction region [Mus musculus]MBK4198767.1 immunoglobulin heavy chain junction region [Mus musculus]MBK4198768.1 immunoglobulin heavy chain junction region [Mus musculus]MBK4198769.1 immunoglobulin heavy chain junction region [Mus musculus]MBK4198770.1 immunoglobulin heavy chain junction region [Mus musculus]
CARGGYFYYFDYW